MTGILGQMSWEFVLLSLLIVLGAGFVKGAVGFAMPMITISGIGSFMPAEIAIAALILPTVITNGLQAFRNGFGDAWASFRKFWRFNLVLFVMILLSAQLVLLMPQWLLFLLLGGMIVVFASLQLAGWRPVIQRSFARATEIGMAMLAGFFGGLTGVWGPPTILYLTAMDVPKKESVRVQGVVYFLGAIMLLAAHLKSGLMNSETAPYSMLLIIPALIGQYFGTRAQDRMDQKRFQKMTLVVLIIAGFNLLRRAVFV